MALDTAVVAFGLALRRGLSGGRCHDACHVRPQRPSRRGERWSRTRDSRSRQRVWEDSLKKIDEKGKLSVRWNLDEQLGYDRRGGW